jgi:hypothetical protein
MGTWYSILSSLYDMTSFVTLVMVNNCELKISKFLFVLCAIMGLPLIKWTFCVLGLSTASHGDNSSDSLIKDDPQAVRHVIKLLLQLTYFLFYVLSSGFSKISTVEIALLIVGICQARVFSYGCIDHSR